MFDNSLLDNLPEAVFIHEFTESSFGKFLYVNEEALRMLGYSKSELMQLSPEDISIRNDPHFDYSEFFRKLKSERKVTFETVLYRKDNSEIDVEISSKIIEYNGTELILSVVRDISERKQLEKKLMLSETKFQKGFYSSPDVITVTRVRDGVYVDINPSFEKVTGYTREEIIGQSAININIWKDIADRNKLVNSLAKYGHIENMKATFIMKDGSEKTGLISASIFHWNNEDYMIMITKVIDDFLKLQIELEKKSKQIQQVFERINDGVIGIDINYRVKYFNKNALKILQIQDENSLYDIKISRLFPRKFHYPFVKIFKKVLAEQKVAKREFYFDDWERWYEARIYPSPEGITIYFTDITENKKNWYELKESKDKYQFLFDYSPVPLWEEDFTDLMECLQGKIREKGGIKKLYDELESSHEFLKECARKVKILEVNQAALKLHHARSKRQLLQGLENIFTNDSYRSFKEELKVLINGETKYQTTTQIKTMDGKLKDVLIHFRVHITERNGKKQYKAFVATIDISHVKKAEREITRLKHALEQSPIGAIILNQSGEIEYINQTFSKRTHFSTQEFCESLNKHFIFEENTSLVQIIQRVFKGEVWTGNAKGVRKDGSQYLQRLIISPISDHQGKIMNALLLSEDITAQKSLEQQLYQAQKMEAIGRLAGGVAHDFNNILTVINGYSDLMLKKMGKEHPFFKYVYEIYSSGQRAAQLTSQLLAFSRKQVHKPQSIKVSSSIKSMESLLRSLLGENLILKFEFKTNNDQIYIDPIQFEQIIMNLAVNARDAMQKGGLLTIAVDLITLIKEKSIFGDTLPPGKYVEVTVTDTGEGINQEILGKIFEPFFTTKDAGKGTGLGLATVYGIIKQNDGFIDVSSEVGIGTTFRMYFPLAHKSHKMKTIVQSDKFQIKSNLTILIVEDEESLRKFLIDTLAEKSIRSFSASTLSEAKQFLENHKNKIDIVITDLVLPDGSGLDLVANIHEHESDLKCVIMSGYSEQNKELEILVQEGIEFLQKPFSINELLEKIDTIFN